MNGSESIDISYLYSSEQPEQLLTSNEVRDRVQIPCIFTSISPTFCSSPSIALNKLEKVALRAARKLGRPLVLVFNNVHFFQHTEEGTNILLQLQQRAEAWAESGMQSILT